MLSEEFDGSHFFECTYIYNEVILTPLAYPPSSSSNEVKCGINNYTSLTRRTPALQYRQRSGAKVIFNKSHFLRTRSMQLTCHNVLLGGNIFCLLKQQNHSKLNFRNVTFLCGKVCSYLVRLLKEEIWARWAPICGLMSLTKHQRHSNTADASDGVCATIVTA